jgi:hypothetical protein
MIVVAVPNKIELDARAARLEARRRGGAFSSAGGGSSGPSRMGSKTGSGETRSFSATLGSDGWKTLLAEIGGPSGHEEPTMAVVRAFEACGGTMDNVSDLVSAVEARLEELRAQGGRDRVYIVAALQNLPGMLSRWIEKKKAEGSPQSCGWIAEIEHDLGDGEKIAGDFIDDLVGEAIALRDHRLRIAEIEASIAAAQKAGDHALARAIAETAGVIDVSPEWSLETITDQDGWSVAVSAEPESEHHALHCSMALGKTRAGIEGAIRAAQNGLRIVVNVARHSLAREWKERIERASPGLGVEVWYGENRGANGRPSCVRAPERAALRRSGIKSDALCGSKITGYCPHHEKRGGSCAYREQRSCVASAQIVLCCGAAMLGAKVPAWFQNAPISKKVVDPRTGLETSITVVVERPPVDLVILDEADFSQLVTGLDDPRARHMPELRTEELTLGALSDFELGPGALLDPANPKHAKQFERLAELTDFVSRLRRVSAARGAGGLLTYGDLYSALDGGGGENHSQIVRRLLIGAYRLVIRERIDPSHNALEWSRGSVVARWNRLALFVAKVLRAFRAALGREHGAPLERETGFLRVADLGVAGGTGLGLQVRRVTPVDRTWGRATLATLDASHRHEWAQRFLPRLRDPVRANVAIPSDSVTSIAVWDKTLGLRAVDQIIDAATRADKPDQRALRELMGFVEIVAARVLGLGKDLGVTPRVDVLVVCAKRLEEAMLDAWGPSKPQHVELWHFGDVRGRDAARGVAAQIVIGRPMPSNVACHDVASVVDGQPSPGGVGDFVRTASIWRSNPDRSMGWSMASRRSTLLDPMAETVRAMACNDELDQAWGRGRYGRRPGERVLTFAVTSEPSDAMPVDHLMTFDEMIAPARNPWIVGASKGVMPKPGGKGSMRALASITGLSLRAVQLRDNELGSFGAVCAQLSPASNVVSYIGPEIVECTTALLPSGPGDQPRGDEGSTGQSSGENDAQLGEGVEPSAMCAQMSVRSRTENSLASAAPVSPAIMSQLAILDEIFNRGTWRTYQVRVSASDRFAETYSIRAGTIDEARDVWAAATGSAPAEIEDASTPGRPRRRRTSPKNSHSAAAPEAIVDALVDAPVVAAPVDAGVVAPEVDYLPENPLPGGNILPSFVDAAEGVEDQLVEAAMPSLKETQNTITLRQLRDACGVSRIKLDRELRTPDARSFIAAQLDAGIALDVAKAGVLSRLVGAERLQAALAALSASASSASSQFRS